MPLSTEKGMELQQLWEAYQTHMTEFYKQVMIISAAGLGFNLVSGNETDNLKIGWPPSGWDAWEGSTFCFFLALISALFVFYSTAVHLRLEVKINNPKIEHSPWSPGFALFWKWVANTASTTVYLSFGLAVWYAGSRFFQ